ncbi:MAG: dolichyl-P-Man:Man(7)GlcNAc(2)-PP-dolichol alpha-1,6-mannosyltransferase [Candelina mexicana]|nr:MAG: dolichyl-P-Man:Man(7)GlcNAc(2)-PP-dolichol alpha-1,6-mannosyltransferase [Candelina mexicana]
MFAFGLSTLALQNFLPLSLGLSDAKARSKRFRLSIYLLTLAGVIFRAELAVLLAAQVAYSFVQKRVTLTREILPAGLGGALIGLLVTVPIDSYFWQSTPLWPELVGFYYNAVQGKSSEWGTSAWHFYIANAVPRLMMNPLTWQLCIPLAVGMKATRKASFDVLIPLAAFIGIYSVQPHKEWRFIVYAVPGLTAIASIGANWIWTRRSKSVIYRFFSLALVASTLGSFAASLGMLAISSLNYPGAEALNRLHELAAGPQRVINVHLDTLSCTTGITRFSQKSANVSPAVEARPLWFYDKTEDPQRLLSPAFWERFDFALAEKPEKVIGRWEIVDVVEGFTGFAILKPNEDSGKGASILAPVGVMILSDASGRSTLLQLLRGFENFVRSRITNGWWIGIRMEPKIRIMKKQTGPINISP